MQSILHASKQSLKGVVFAAKVVNNSDDPEDKGRVRVRIPRLYDGVPDDMLPWAEPHTFGPLVYVPDVGAYIYVELLDGNPYHPVYYNEAKGNTSLGIFQDEYPNAWGLQDQAGNYIKFNKSTKTIKINSATGANIFIDDQGNVKVTSPKNIEATAAEDIKLTSTGKTEIVATEDVTVTTQANLTATVTGNLTSTVTGVAQITAAQILLN